jgi:prepilin-type processing-associated H-X9-DG protein
MQGANDRWGRDHPHLSTEDRRSSLVREGTSMQRTASTAHGDGIDIAQVAMADGHARVADVCGALEETCRTLVHAGRAPATPAAVVQWATTPEQRSVTGTLESVATLAVAASIGPPATLIIGDVVALAGATRQPGPTKATTFAIDGTVIPSQGSTSGRR